MIKSKASRTRLSVISFTVVAAVLASLAAGDEVFTAKRSIVVSGHPEAVRLGDAVLDAGGNAIDAFVTVSLALGVTEPGNSGLGGKLALLYYDAKTRRVYAMTALEAAPLKTDIQSIINMSSDQRRRGWASVCTPGHPAGLHAAHKKWGTKNWSELVDPVARLAEEGFELSPLAAEMMAEFPAAIDPEAARVYAGNGKAAAGSRLANPDLARTLRRFSEKGHAGFYEGEVAQAIVDAAARGGSPLSLDDLKAYEPRFTEPLKITYKGQAVYSGPPPLTGGATVLATLLCLEKSPWPAAAKPRNGDYIDHIGRILQQVYPEVQRAAGDAPDSGDRVSKLLAPDSIAKLVAAAKAADVKSPRASIEQPAPVASSSPQSAIPNPQSHEQDDLDSASTTHLVIVDGDGNIVCATQSLGNHFGAAVVAPGTGVLMNNSMNNFAFQTTSSVNYITPGKQPRSTIAPTIVIDKAGKPLLALGAPGGQRIPTGVLQVLLDVLDFDRPLDKAIAAPRFHIRRPATRNDPANKVDVDIEMGTELEEDLANRGWVTERRKRGEFYFGAVNAVMMRPDGTMLGVADQRRTGDAGGD